ncbi:tetratricopeptide repeat protein, partial [Escherichia fergusonii]|uniref:tetratricopeptide repeat protein n=1 Tax=Escherichia fergusonii TaxID=564 RepID=UPI001CBE60AF
LGQLDEARRLLSEAYRAKPDPEIAAHLGEVLWIQGERDEARRLWREGLQRDPANETLRSTLKRLKIRL